MMYETHAPLVSSFCCSALLPRRVRHGVFCRRVCCTSPVPLQVSRVLVKSAFFDPWFVCLLHGCVLWFALFLQEWAVLFPSHVACYMPLSKKPAWLLPLRTLHKVGGRREVEKRSAQPHHERVLGVLVSAGQNQTGAADSLHPLLLMLLL